MIFPQHKCGLYLCHNGNRDYYQTVEKYLEDHDTADWENDDSKKRAIDTDEIWELQWYPNTPIGFYRVAAPTLEEVMAYALKVEQGESHGQTNQPR